MTRRYTGGFLSSKEQVTDANTANGVYTTQEAGALTAAGTFPTGRWTPQNSLRFRASATAALTRTNAASGSATTFTWSAWVKRGQISTTDRDQWLFHGSNYNSGISQPNLEILFRTGADASADCFSLNIEYSGAGTNTIMRTSNRLRDPSAWYHLVAAVDTTQTVASNRIKLYVNSVQQTDFQSAVTYPTQNLAININQAGMTPTIGAMLLNNGLTRTFDGYMSEVNYVDGQQLDPSYFGSTDPETGTWIPKRYTGTYGTNGFYLPFSNNGTTTALGLDMSPSKNIITYSEQFDNAAWTKTNLTVTANAVNDPLNATLTADKVIPSATNGYHIIQSSLSGVVTGSTYYTLSFYVKAAGYNEIELAEANTTGSYAYFDLTNGVVIGSAGSNNQSLYDTSASIQNVGNGWYRCAFTFKTGSSQTAISSTAYLGNNGVYSFAGDTTSGIYFWGAQINAGKFANTYVTTTSAGVTNDWTPNNISLTAGVTYDSMVDVPGIAAVTSQPDVGGVQRGNYCTWNSTAYTPNVTFSNGNLTATSAVNSVKNTWGSIAVGSGKWYFEQTVTAISDSYRFWLGFSEPYQTPDSFYLYDIPGFSASWNAGNTTVTYGMSSKRATSTNQGWDSSVTVSDSKALNDVFMFAYDGDTGKIWFGKNGTWFSSGSPSAGANPAAILKTEFNYTPSCNLNVTGAGNASTLNCGQRPFAYTPPTGFKTLCTTNLPNPVIKRPSDHFDTKLYTGNGVALTVGTTAKQTSAVAINRSLKFRKISSTTLNKTFGTAPTSRTTITLSAWVKRNSLSAGTTQALFGTSNNYENVTFFTDDTIRFTGPYSSSQQGIYITNQTFKDTTAWYHIVSVYDTTNVSPVNRMRLYVNGVQITSFSSVTNSNLNNTTTEFLVNGFTTGVGTTGASGSGSPFDGYMAEVNVIDGQALTPSSFGQFDANNNWVPKTYTGTYGNNGFYLPFNLPSTPDTASYGASFSGSTQGLSTTASGSFNPGAGTWTVEGWAYSSSASANESIITGLLSGSDRFYWNYGGTTLYFGDGTTNTIVVSNAKPTNRWFHWAAVKNGATYTLYIDGVAIGTTTSALISSTLTTWQIGMRTSQSTYWNGIISNIRVVTGTAVYTAGFNPPTTLLTAISGTQLLTCNSATLVDNSGNSNAITNTGSVPVVDATPWKRTVGYDASGNNNNFYPTGFNTVPPAANMPNVLYYGTPGTYTWTAPAGVTSVNYLVVAGGGGGGGDCGGGGGGGMLTGTLSVTPSTSYTVTVGNGGVVSYPSTNGGNSVFSSITAVGGGRGGDDVYTGGNGGSGGGGGYNSGAAAGTGTGGQGNNGGAGQSGAPYATGGGGGAGGAGGSYAAGGNGGPGLASSISGSTIYYAGGGGGRRSSPGTGGIGGGGTANLTNGINAKGTDGLGGGGGGTGGSLSGGGGSGVVILSYTNAASYVGNGVGTSINNDSGFDSPTDTVDSSGNTIGNYAVIDNSNNNGLSITNAGTAWTGVGATPRMAYATLPISRGKWYFEYTMSASSSGGNWAAGFGQADVLPAAGTSLSTSANGWVIMTGGNATVLYKVNNNTFTNLTGLWTGTLPGAIIGVAVDYDAGKAWFSKDGVWVEGDPAAGTNSSFSSINAYGPIKPYVYAYNPSDSGVANFGQSRFVYAPPNGFKSINTKNLKDVGSYNLPDTFGNFVNTPDLVWLKNRTSASGGGLWNTVVGPSTFLQTTNTNGPASTGTSFNTFLPNGFSLGADSNITNNAGNNYVSWNWNRGITPGFDIVNFGSNGAIMTVPHNLGQVPKFMIVKGLNGVTSWVTQHASVGPTGNIRLDSNAAVNTSVDWWGNAAPTSTNFTIGVNFPAGYSWIAYLWAEVPGFSKFGSFTGNNLMDGPFVYTGFKPAFILIKRTDVASDWFILDNKRGSYNPIGAGNGGMFAANQTYAESTLSTYAILDIVSNGFKIRSDMTYGYLNASGGNYVYAAYAETPFKYGTAR